MFLISIKERESDFKNFSTVENLTQLYRSLSVGLDIQKFINMSNMDLFMASFDFDFDYLIMNNSLECLIHDCFVENLADSVYEYMNENIEVYYDIVKKIDEYRQQVKNYNVDK